MWSITIHYIFNTFSWNLPILYSLHETITDMQTQPSLPRQKAFHLEHHITSHPLQHEALPPSWLTWTDVLLTEICTSFAEKGHRILSMQPIMFLCNNYQVIPYFQEVVICLSKLVTLDDYSRTLFRLIFKIHFKCSANMNLVPFWFTTFSSNWINFTLQKISFYLCREKQVFILSDNEIIFSHKIYSDEAFSPQKL